jgi:integrase
MMQAYLAEKPSDTATYSWRALEPFWGPLRADQITTARCREYAQMRRDKGRGDGTILREMAVLKACVKRYASDAGAVFEMPSSPPPKNRHLTRAEFRALMENSGELHMRLFMLLALSTGARAGAILSLTWNQIDFEREQIDLGIGNGNKGRAVVPMTNSLKTALRAASQQRSTPFVIEYRGRPVKSIRKGFERACERAGLDDVTPHVLRHTAAVWMAEGGTSMAEIAQFLGHSSEKVTFKIYARYSPDFLRRAASALEV